MCSCVVGPMGGADDDIRSHLDAFGERLLQRITEQLDKRNAALDSQMKELLEENRRLRTELCIDYGSIAMDEADPCCPKSVDMQQVDEGQDHACDDDDADSQKIPTFTSARPRVSTVDSIFSKLDVSCIGVLKIKVVQEKLMEIVQDDANLLGNFPCLVSAFRAGKPELFHGLQEDEISSDAFKQFMLGEDMKWLGDEHVQTLKIIRSVNDYEDAEDVIAEANALRREEVFGSVEEDPLWWLEPFVGVVIIVNAAIIGLGEEFEEWEGVWKVGAGICTLGFIMELVLKISFQGWRVFFFGPEWKWHIFDFLLVVFACIELVVDIAVLVDYTGTHQGAKGVRQFTVLRMVRLLRLARLAQLFRLKQMKELTLMAMGIIGGMRTLFWSFVLLIVIVYIFGILFHHIMHSWKKEMVPCDHPSRNSTFADNSTYACSEFEVLVDQYYDNMFGSLARSCLTVFRCITGDCSLPGGTPIIPSWVDALGPGPVVLLFTCNIFVTVCVFNLIMAVFVESTLDAAKHEQKNGNQEQIRHAKTLQLLVDKMVRHQREPKECMVQEDALDKLWKYVPNKGFLATADAQQLGYEVKMPRPFRVNKEAFDAAMAEEDADDILEDLEISVRYKGNLFEILDSDGDGTLDLHEVVDGIMRLRGPAEKSDIVANGLMIRAMQKKIVQMKGSVEKVKQVLHGAHRHSPAGFAQQLQTQRSSRQITAPKASPTDVDYFTLPPPMNSSVKVPPVTHHAQL